MARLAAKPRPVIVALQGGAAHGAFSWGVLEAMLENPDIEIVGASGTSSGALTAAFLIEGLAKGGRAMALERLQDCWEGLTDYQRLRTPLLLHIYEKWHAACVEIGVPHLAAANREMVANFEELALASPHPMFPESPILGFLKWMRESGNGLDLDAIRQAKNLPIAMNGTEEMPGRDIWHALPGDERVATNDQITESWIAASGSLTGLMPPVIINGMRLRDGAYTANPHLQKIAALCRKKGADLALIRTRPAHAIKPWNGKTPANNEERKAFFNTVTDKQIEKLKPQYPDLHVHIVEPRNLEPQEHLTKPEFRFHEPDVRRRRDDGYVAGTDAFAKPQARQYAYKPALMAMAAE